MGAGVLLLGALGVAAYSWLAPAARPQPPVAADSAPAPVVTALAPASAAAVLPLPAPVPAPPVVFDISREFERIVQAATPGFELRTQVNKTVLRIDRDELSFTLQSEREGFVYVFLYGADKVLMQLYPNIDSGTLKIRKGQTLKLPQSPVVLGVTEPAGPGELLVLVSARQRDHAELRSSKDGAFRVFATDAAGAEQAARHSGPVPLLAGRAICPGATQCADEFGATEIKVEVVR